ncbi:hypothetical protein Efla_004857 [Eimeria flavescens]
MPGGPDIISWRALTIDRSKNSCPLLVAPIVRALHLSSRSCFHAVISLAEEDLTLEVFACSWAPATWSLAAPFSDIGPTIPNPLSGCGGSPGVETGDAPFPDYQSGLTASLPSVQTKNTLLQGPNDAASSAWMMNSLWRAAEGTVKLRGFVGRLSSGTNSSSLWASSAKAACASDPQFGLGRGCMIWMQVDAAHSKVAPSAARTVLVCSTHNSSGCHITGPSQSICPRGVLSNESVCSIVPCIPQVKPANCSSASSLSWQVGVCASGPSVARALRRLFNASSAPRQESSRFLGCKSSRKADNHSLLNGKQPHTSVQPCFDGRGSASLAAGAELRTTAPAFPLASSSLLDLAGSPVGPREAGSDQQDAQSDSQRRSVFAVALAIALIVPANEEEGANLKPGCGGAADEKAGGAAESRSTSEVDEGSSSTRWVRTGFLRRLVFFTDVMLSQAAEGVQTCLNPFNLMMGPNARDDRDASESRTSLVAGFIWETISQRAIWQPMVVTHSLDGLRTSSKKIQPVCNEAERDQEDDSNVAFGSEFQEERMSGTADPPEVKGVVGPLRCGPAVQTTGSAAVCQSVKRQGPATTSAANSQREQQQLDSAGKGIEAWERKAPRRRTSWFTAFLEALGTFFNIFISVCQRLLFVVPLALAAATAGFWLVTVPYITAGLELIGVEKNWVLQWDAAAQHELKEVIFTSITAAASAAGPTYVKFLQWIATRPDLFPESLCSRCAKLQTAVRPFSYPRAAFILREQFGEDVAQHLILDPTPIGCGCIAQVYRAYLLLSDSKNSDSRRRFLEHAFVLGDDESKPAALAAQADDGSKLPPVAVAVKVMRPGVREAMEFDLRMMLLVASAVQCLPAFDFVAVQKSVEEFGVAMRRQLDFGLEEKHIKRFRTNFGLPSPSVPPDLLPLHNKCRPVTQAESTDISSRDVAAQPQQGGIMGFLPLKGLGMRRQVAFPYPFEALSSNEVLVMTLEGGFTLNQLFKAQKKLQEAEQSSLMMGDFLGDTALAHAAKYSHAPPELAKRFNSIGMICLHSFLQMVFLDNFFHGDMHSGNLLCRFARESPELIFPLLSTTAATRPSSDTTRREGQLELLVLDCGLAGSLSQADRVNFVTLLEAIGMRRGRDAAIAMLRRARLSACKYEEQFCSEVEKLVNEHHFKEGNPMQMRKAGFTSLMGRMLSLSKEYSVELDPAFVSLVVAMSILEGVGAQLCPDTDVLKATMPYSSMAAKLLRLAISRES